MAPRALELSRDGQLVPSSGLGDEAADGPDATDRAIDTTRAAVVDSSSEHTVDPNVLSEALALAALHCEPRPRPRSATVAGTRTTVPRPYSGQNGEIELDLTSERLLEAPFPRDDDFMVLEPRSTERHVVLAVDISGSMRGERVLTTAATVAVLASHSPRTHVAVLAFWSDAAWICRFDETLGPRQLVERLLRIPARGLTNVAFPLELAAAEHRRAASPRPETILLTDCEHNAGADPRAAIRGGSGRLSIVLDTTGPHDAELARQLVRNGGRLRTVSGHREVPGALEDILH